MTNLDVINMTEDEFLEEFNKVKSAMKEKKAINTAAIRIDEQAERFLNFSQSEESEKALFEDASSV